MYIVFIHGPAASGKHTIGSKVSETLGIPLFHNHLTVDLATCLFEFGSSGFRQLREKIWLASFRAAAEADQSFVFTFFPEQSVDPDLIETLQEIIEESGGEVHYIELLCSDTAVMERLDDPSRARFGKLRDKELYAQLAAAGSFDFPALPSALLRVDTESLSAEQAATAIVTGLNAAKNATKKAS